MNIVDNYKNDRWCMWRFKDRTHKEPVKPHYYVVIPSTENTFLLACLITSQIEKKEQFYEGSPIKEYLVRTNPKELSCLKKDSLIDCNLPIYVSKEEFKERMENLEIINVRIPKTLKNRIISKLQKSSVVKPAIKDAINIYADR